MAGWQGGKVADRGATKGRFREVAGMTDMRTTDEE